MKVSIKMKKIFLILCIAALMCMTALAMNGMAADNWSPDSFTNHYRVFVNGTSTPLTDYQVKLVLHNVTGDNAAENIYLPGIVQPNYNDVRFAMSDGTQLNYWMEKPTGTNYATFWVKIPSIPQGTENSVAVDIYYGNSTIGSAANGDATFPLFDDFDGTSLNTSKWTVTSGTAVVNNSQLTLSGSATKIYSIKQFQNNASLSTDFNYINIGYSSEYCGFSNTALTEMCMLAFYNPTKFYTKAAGKTDTSLIAGSIPSMPFKSELKWNRTAVTAKVASNPSVVGIYTPSITLPIFLQGRTGDSFNWLFVRKLVDIEPTIYTPVPEPVADFAANATNGTVPLTVKFIDKSTGFPITWAWDFDNDGVVDNTTQNPTCTYNVPGNYSVNLTVSNSAGSNLSLKTNLIQVNALQPPVANFTADTLSGDAPLTVHFTDLSTGIINSQEWDFDNDGTIDSTEQNPTYTFNIPGNYTVSLTAANYGGNNTVSSHIIVNTPTAPAADFTADKTNGIAPLTVHFTGQSTGIVTAWAWDFNNDGKIDATTQNATYAYSDPGSYTVNLTITNAGGSNSTIKTDYMYPLQIE
jgi:PKD repeat protein